MTSIIFYDIPSTNPGSTWSPNIFKTKYTLHFKGLPYETEWVEFPDIEPLCRKLGIPPTSTKPDGNDHYTLPAIHDPSTGVYIADSLLIAEYLEKTYPDTPKVFPNNTIALQISFVEAFMGKIKPLWQFIIPVAGVKLCPRSEEYYRHKNEKLFGKALERVIPKGENADEQWGKFRDGLADVEAWYAKNGEGGTFLLGGTASWGDIVVASCLVCLKIIWGKDSQQWKDISSWNNGRWTRIIEAFNLEYHTVV